VKTPKGHKADRKDAEHLADVPRHSHAQSAIFRSRFVNCAMLPGIESRSRRMLPASEIEVQKLLEQTNMKIAGVLTDIFGCFWPSVIVGNNRPRSSSSAVCIGPGE
jgi:hypothetical protein